MDDICPLDICGICRLVCGTMGNDNARPKHCLYSVISPINDDFPNHVCCVVGGTVFYCLEGVSGTSYFVEKKGNDNQWLKK